MKHLNQEKEDIPIYTGVTPFDVGDLLRKGKNIDELKPMLAPPMCPPKFNKVRRNKKPKEDLILGTNDNYPNMSAIIRTEKPLAFRKPNDLMILQNAEDYMLKIPEHLTPEVFSKIIYKIFQKWDMNSNGLADYAEFRGMFTELYSTIQQR